MLQPSLGRLPFPGSITPCTNHSAAEKPWEIL